MNKIQVLSEEIINLIAAGEVVERPSSVVKELMENAIDADATKIVVKINNYGNTLISVEDDGHGISNIDAPNAFVQHATSKIKTRTDLETIGSFGFRGEALASISSVAGKAILKSKTENESGVLVKKENNTIEHKEHTKPLKGTIIEIHNLFEKVPARKKFLKKGSTELSHIVNTFLQTSLPYINIHFELVHNGSILYKLTRVSKLIDRIFELTDTTTIKNLYTAEKIFGEIKISGFIGNSFIGKKKNNNQYIFINNRYVRSGLINKAVKEAYRGFLHTDLQPTYFLFINVPLHTVDVNIHPRKLEVRFDDEQFIYKTVFNFIKQTLELETKKSLTSTLKHSYDSARHNVHKTSDFPQTSSPIRSTLGNVGPKRQQVKQAIDFTKHLYVQDGATDYASQLTDEDSTEIDENILDQAKTYFQLFNTYIVTESDAKLIFIDQHAAAEKILFEKLLKSISTIIETKPLLIPQIITLDNTFVKEEVLEKKEQLAKVGLIYDDFGELDIQVLEVPEIIREDSKLTELFKEIIQPDETQYVIEESNELPDTLYLQLATIACHGSIRAGQRLSNQEMGQIVNDLRELRTPGNCPHGRPVLWSIRKTEIEKNFNRDI